MIHDLGGLQILLNRVIACSLYLYYLFDMTWVDVCGYHLWKPSRDSTRPLGVTQGFKGLMHRLNAFVTSTKVKIIFFFCFSILLGTSKNLVGGCDCASKV